jgi:hypothetical protein
LQLFFSHNVTFISRNVTRCCCVSGVSGFLPRNTKSFLSGFLWPIQANKKPGAKMPRVLKEAKLLVHSILQSFAGLEGGSLAGSDFHGSAGAGVAGHAGRTALRFESAKADQLHFVTLGQALSDHVENAVQSRFGFFLGHFGLGCQSRNQFTFIHQGTLLAIFLPSQYIPTVFSVKPFFAKMAVFQHFQALFILLSGFRNRFPGGLGFVPAPILW